MLPEKPVWIWKGDPQFALLELVLLVLFFYLSFRFSAYLTYRFELVRMHSKRLDRLAFRAGCTREERDLLQSFYSQLDRRHRVLLAHNHAKEYLRQHLLHYIATLDSKDFQDSFPWSRNFWEQPMIRDPFFPFVNLPLYKRGQKLISHR